MLNFHDFEMDPKLKNAQKITLLPSIGLGYKKGVSPSTYPYQAVVNDLTPNKKYYFVIRAVDTSPNRNEDKNTNTNVLSTTILY